jgi:DNA primase
MSFSSAFLEKIKTSVKISDIASRHVNWDLKKSNTSKQDFWAPCPFHQEKTASFHVDDTKGFYYCFGCQAKGNIFTFLNEMEGVSFFDAVKALSEMAGIPLEIDDDKKRMTTSNEEQRLININEIASEFFRKYLFSTKGSIALSYLRDRGLSLEIIKEFQLGFSPSRPDDLTNFLKSQGYNEQFIEKSGLAFKPENKPLVDRFRNRIMFPISDSNNNIVAFGGRSLNTAYGAKYINSSETKIFKKGSLLFNFKNAQKSKKNDPLIVVEGYMDVISLANNSIKNAVAPLGTSMTKEQLQLIWRACEEPILLLDGDNAGKLATSRAVDLALPLISYNQTLRIANLPTNYDPDDLLKQHGKDALKDVIENSQTLSEFIFTNEKSQRKIDSPERLRKLHVELTRKIQKIKDFSLKKMFLAEMSDKIRKTKYPSQTDTKRSSSPMLGDNKINIKKKTMSHVQASEKEIEMLEAEIMFCLIKNPTFIKDFKETLTDLDFSDEFFQKSLWKIQHEPFSKTTEICISISSQATKKNPTLKNHLIYNDQKKQEMSRNLLINRITTLNLAKNRLESLKDLKIKIKTQESDSPYQNESLEKIQREYHRAIGGSQFVEDSILREREFDKGSLDIFKKIKEKSSERNNG